MSVSPSECHAIWESVLKSLITPNSPHPLCDVCREPRIRTRDESAALGNLISALHIIQVAKKKGKQTAKVMHTGLNYRKEAETLTASLRARGYDADLAEDYGEDEESHDDCCSRSSIMVNVKVVDDTLL